jgi:hypothetical protein
MAAAAGDRASTATLELFADEVMSRFGRPRSSAGGA